MSIFLEDIHSKRHGSWMYLMEPLHLQGWYSGLSSVASPLQIRHVAPGGISSVSSVCVVEMSFAMLVSTSGDVIIKWW